MAGLDVQFKQTARPVGAVNDAQSARLAVVPGHSGQMVITDPSELQMNGAKDLFDLFDDCLTYLARAEFIVGVDDSDGRFAISEWLPIDGGDADDRLRLAHQLLAPVFDEFVLGSLKKF